MGYYSVVFCDRCNDGNLRPDNRGRILYWDEAKALKDAGWAERDVGIICTDCITDEETRAAADEAAGAQSGVGIGAFAEATLQAAGNPEGTNAESVAATITAEVGAVVAASEADPSYTITHNAGTPSEQKPKRKRGPKRVRI